MDWREAFAPHILKRGYNYAKEERVTLHEQNDAQITATVKGRQDYEVCIELEKAEVVSMSCTCPYAEENDACKHMAAVLYCTKLFHQPTEPQPDWLSLRDAVEMLPKHILQELLLQHAGTSQALRREIMLQATGKIPNEQKTLWYQRIQRIIRSYCDSHGYADGTDALYLMEDLTDYMDKEIEQLWLYGMYEAAFELVCMVFQCVSLLDHSDESFTELFLHCDEWWENLLEKADDALRQTMHAWFVSALKTSRYYAKSWLQKTFRTLFEQT